jgi:hypothetical protein
MRHFTSKEPKTSTEQTKIYTGGLEMQEKRTTRNLINKINDKEQPVLKENKGNTLVIMHEL